MLGRVVFVVLGGDEVVVVVLEGIPGVPEVPADGEKEEIWASGL